VRLILLNIIAAFLAFGILHIQTVGGWEGWRWLFALEGALTAIIGIVSWFYLPPSPTQTASWFRGKDGWFNEREEVIMVNRVLRDDPGKVLYYNLPPEPSHSNSSLILFFPLQKGRHAQPSRLDPQTPLGLTYGLGSVAPICNQLHVAHPDEPRLGLPNPQPENPQVDTFQTNLLTIPAYVLFLIQLVFWSWLSERINNRMAIILFYSFWVLPLLVALELLPSTVSPWSWYAVTVLLIGFPYIHSINGMPSISSINLYTLINIYCKVA
jgi:hypothetical protein